MHVSELFKAATDGDNDALDELIERQQDGKALRYYPNGRRGALDEGLVPVKIESSNGSVVIRSGQPRKGVAINKKTAGSWLRGIPECLVHAARARRKSGEDKIGIYQSMADDSTDDFGFRMTAVSSSNEITCKFLPEGEPQWIMSPDDISNLLKKLLEACNDLEWTYEISDEEMNSIKLIIGEG